MTLGRQKVGCFTQEVIDMLELELAGVTTKGVAYVKTLHLLSTVNAERYIEKGTLKSLTNDLSKV